MDKVWALLDGNNFWKKLQNFEEIVNQWKKLAVVNQLNKVMTLIAHTVWCKNNIHKKSICYTSHCYLSVENTKYIAHMFYFFEVWQIYLLIILRMYKKYLFVNILLTAGKLCSKDLWFVLHGYFIFWILLTCSGLIKCFYWYLNIYEFNFPDLILYLNNFENSTGCIFLYITKFSFFEYMIVKLSTLCWFNTCFTYKCYIYFIFLDLLCFIPNTFLNMFILEMLHI